MKLKVREMHQDTAKLTLREKRAVLNAQTTGSLWISAEKSNKADEKQRQ